MQLGGLIEKLAADVPSQQEGQSINITKVEKLSCFAVKKMLAEPTKVNGTLNKSQGLQKVPL